MNDQVIFNGDFNESERKAQEIFDSHMKFTAEMILHLQKEHQHYTDDCGDYLMAALEIASLLQQERMEGIENLVIWLRDAQPRGEDWLLENYASDGISPVIYDFFNGKITL